MKRRMLACNLLAVGIILSGAVVNLLPGASQLQVSAASVTPPPAYSGKCVAQYPTAPAHAANSLSPSGFSTVGSTAIGQMGTMSPASGDPSWEGADQVNTMAQVGNTVYVGGVFNSYKWKGTTYTGFYNVMALNATTGAPVLSFKPKVVGGSKATPTTSDDYAKGEVLTITPSCTGTILYIGGKFTSVNGTTRHYLAKVAVSNGTLSTWNPAPNGVIDSVSTMRGHLVIAGQFTSINGVARDGIASLDPSSASPKPDSWLDIGVYGYEEDANISNPSTRDGARQQVYQVVPNHSGTYAVMTGNFNDVGTKTTEHRRIAILELTDSKVILMPWHTAWTKANATNAGTDCSQNYEVPERGATWAPSDAYFYLADTGGAHYGSICDSISQWSASPASLSSTNAAPRAIMYTGGDTLTGVACTNVSCVASGHERWGNNPVVDPAVAIGPGNPAPYNVYCSPSPTNPSAVSGHIGYNCQDPGVSKNRPGILEVSVTPITVAHQTRPELPVTSWNPGRSQMQAMHNFEMITPQGLWVATDGDAFGGCKNPGIGDVSGCTPHNDLVLIPFTTPLK